MDRAEEILRLVAAHSWRQPEQIDRSDIFGAGRLAGDDADEFLRALTDAYGTDFSTFCDYLHFDSNEPPGITLTTWGVKPDGQRLAIIPVSLQDLVTATEIGRWQMCYPEHRIVDIGWIYFRILPLVAALILLLTALFLHLLPAHK